MILDYTKSHWPLLVLIMALTGILVRAETENARLEEAIRQAQTSAYRQAHAEGEDAKRAAQVAYDHANQAMNRAWEAKSTADEAKKLAEYARDVAEGGPTKAEQLRRAEEIRRSIDGFTDDYLKKQHDLYLQRELQSKLQLFPSEHILKAIDDANEKARKHERNHSD